MFLDIFSLLLYYDHVFLCTEMLHSSQIYLSLCFEAVQLICAVSLGEAALSSACRQAYASKAIDQTYLEMSSVPCGI